MKPKVLVVLGPTATGKSDLAVALAKKFNGEVISADSRQVYRGLDLGSGKVSRDKKPPAGYSLLANYYHNGIRHWMLDVASPRSVFTAQKYQKLASKALSGIHKRGKLPIIAGGTGLYIDAVINGTVFPEVPPNIKLRKTLEKLSTVRLFARIRDLDIVRAKTIDPHNRPRLIRAIEIAKALGRVPVRQPADKKDSPYEVLKIGLTMPKEELEKRIKKRLEKRLKLGMVKEVENLHKQGLSWKRLDDLGLEYRYISRYLCGLITYDQMKSEILKESLHYTKRQMTWFKRDKNIVWETDRKKMESLVLRFSR